MTVKNYINHYLIQKQLAKKPGRRTFLAKDLETQELVVIKLLSFGNGFEWQDLKLFEREAQTLKNLKHPSIPKYLDYFEVKSENFTGFALVQSYIEARTLEEYVKSGVTFTESEVKKIALKILNLLNYLHSLSPPLIHRDIKPSNILLSDRSGNNIGKIYLIDFGSVQTAVARESQTITVVGTYGYMPQEQFGDRSVPASDIYSLGATLIYLLTATHPADLPQQNFRIKFEYLTNLSPVFNDWLRLMIEPSLEKRFDSAKIAIEVLEKPLQKSSHVKIVNKYDFLVTAKPKNSKIKITKNPNYLEIDIPPEGLNIKKIFTAFYYLLVVLFTTTIFMTFISVFISFFLDFIIPSLSFETIFPFVIEISFILILTIVFKLIYTLLLSMFGHNKMIFNLHETIIRKKLFGIKFNHHLKYSKYTIDKLVYVPEYWEKSSSSSGSITSADRIPSHIIAWSGIKKYKILSLDWYEGLLKSEEELKWLGYELSQWLSVEISEEKII